MASDPQFSATPTRRSNLRSILLLVGAAFIAGLIVAVVLVRYYAGWAGAPTRTAAGTTASSGIGSMFVPPPEADSTPRAPDAAALEARLGILSARLAGLESRAAMIDRDSELAAGNAGRAESLLIAFAARRAIDRGLSLGYLEGQLRNRFGATQPRAVATILDAAHNPVTVEDLRLSLDAIGPQLITGGTADGWWPSFHREITGLIVIHKEGTPSPRPSDRMARIRRLVDARQIEAAVAEVARMPGADQAGAWTAAANRYVAAHRALDIIETVAIIGGQNDPAAMAPGKLPMEKPTDDGQQKPAAAATTETKATASLP